MELTPSRFTFYTLSPQEASQAAVFTSLNIAHLSNIRAQAAEDKLNLTYDPLNPIAFAQREAELHGVISTIDNLINEHEAAQIRSMQLKLDSSSK
jgi:hypothetical protein